MADDSFLPETTHFGLTRVGSGEPWSKNGWSFSDLDRSKLDALLYAAFTHTHDGSPALGDPTDPPTLVANPTGGSLPAATTYYYRVSLLDEHGLETAASTEASVVTPDPLDPPTAPSTTVQTSGGTVQPGIYAYLVTFVDNYGGETTPSSLASAQVIGGTANQIRLDLPDMPTGVASFNIYRSRPGQSQFYLIGNATSTTFYDTAIVEDQTITAPSINSTNASNSVDVTVPAGFIPLGCFSWRIYRATAAGGYDGNSLVHEVTEGTTDDSITPITVWTDTGDALMAGFPQNSTSTVPHGSLLTLNQITGTLPLSAMARGSNTVSAFAPGTVTSTTVTVTESPADVKPVRLTAYFQTPPTTGGVTLSVTVADSAGTPNVVTLDCSPGAHQVGDATGYFHTEWPLMEAANFEAEAGTFSDDSVLIDNDDAAVSGQAVTLDTATQWVQVPLGSLDKGDYQTFATVRVLTYGTTSATLDLHVQVVETDGTVVDETTFNLTPSSPPVDGDFVYQELTGPAFTAAGGVDLFLRVAKVDATNTTAYDVDSMRYTSTVPTLQAGPLTFSTVVSGGSSDAQNANIALWF